MGDYHGAFLLIEIDCNTVFSCAAGFLEAAADEELVVLFSVEGYLDTRSENSFINVSED